MVDGLVLVDDGEWVVTGKEDEAGLVVVVGPAVEFVVEFVDGDVWTGEVDEAGLVVVGLVVEFVVGEDFSLEELAEAVGVVVGEGVVGKGVVSEGVVEDIVLLVDEVFVEEGVPFLADAVTAIETASLCSKAATPTKRNQ